MPKPSADEVVTKVKHVRQFIQFKGPFPTKPLLFNGQDAQRAIVGGVTVPEFGTIDPIYAPSVYDSDEYDLIGRKINTPELPQATVTFLERHGSLPRQLQEMGCFNLYNYVGQCKDLSDQVAGWDDYVLIYSSGMVENKNLGDRSTWDDDTQVEDELPAKFAAIYPIGKLSFGDQAQAIITLEVIDAVFANATGCAECSVDNDGTQWAYAVTKSTGTTPGTAPRLIYTVDGGVTWGQAAIDGLGDTEDPAGIDIVGGRLLVYTRTAGGPTISGYYWSDINTATGVPGTWTKVTSGFVASFQVYDCVVLSSREVFFCADGGYIYKSTDITSGVTVVSPGNATTTALRRIHGKGNVLVAVGGSGTVIKSINRGVTWQTTTTSPIVATLQAIAVVDDGIFWIGSASGTLHYSLNGGENWTQQTFDGSGAGQIRDIVFVSDEVGFFSHDTATPTGRLFATWTGGTFWTRSAPRINNMVTANRFNRVVTPGRSVHVSIASNIVLLAGLAGNGSDGVLVLGQANRL